MGVLERLNDYIVSKGISMKAFEESVSMSNGSLGKTIKEGNGIRTDKLENILLVYPDLSAEWLLRGVGSMILDDKEQSGSGANNKYFMICQLLLQNRQKDNELYSELAKLMSKE